MNLDTSLVADKKANLFDIGQLSCYVSYDTLPTEQLVIGQEGEREEDPGPYLACDIDKVESHRIHLNTLRDI